MKPDSSFRILRKEEKEIQSKREVEEDEDDEGNVEGNI